MPLELDGAVGPADEVVLLVVAGKTETPLLVDVVTPVPMLDVGYGPYGGGGRGTPEYGGGAGGAVPEDVVNVPVLGSLLPVLVGDVELAAVTGPTEVPDGDEETDVPPVLSGGNGVYWYGGGGP